MNDLFWLVMLFPLVWPLLAKVIFHTSINWQEVGISIATCCLLTWGVWSLGAAAKSWDVEILNGEVTGKQQERVSCQHSYSCYCTTDKDGRTSCQTCYEHSHDFDWVVTSNVGSTTIDRIDRRGTDEPPRFTAVSIGEPFARTNSYRNWIKASDSSLFHIDDDDKLKDLPAYPGAVFDYYRVDRLVTDGVAVTDAALWNRDISEALRELGPKRQANLVVVITAKASAQYAEDLKRFWQGAKKNDVVVVIGAPAYPAIAWAKVFSISKNETVNVAMRDRIIAQGNVDRPALMAIIVDEISRHFERRSMKEFEYLKDDIEPPMAAVIIAMIIAIGGSVGLTVFFHYNEMSFFKSQQRR